VNAVAAPRAEARWLLVFNCQALGLANCLSLAAPSVAVEYCDFPRFRKNPAEYLDRIGEFDLVITSPQLQRTQYADFGALAPTRLVPTMVFDAYHPDLCLLHEGEALLKGPLGDYHSSLAFAAWRQGLSQADARKLFAAKTYERLGYFDRWAPARQRLLSGFAAQGLDIAGAFARWTDDASAFMHSVNHPAIRCLRDVARLVVRAAGLEDRSQHFAPHDNLLNGPMFPVFPEIAERYSVEGSYRFKLGGQYRHVDLAEFIRGSYETYDRTGRDAIAVPSGYAALHEKIVQAF